MYEFKFPFDPPWETLQREVTVSNGVKCYLFDACVIADSTQRAELDGQNGQLLADLQQRGR